MSLRNGLQESSIEPEEPPRQSNEDLKDTPTWTVENFDDATLQTEIEYYEIEEFQSSESSSGKRAAECIKNPGHENFIPIKEFNIGDLPPKYRTETLVKCIKSVSDLTVKVEATIVSLDRPDRYDYLNSGYHLFKKRGRHVKRSGTGTVSGLTLVMDNEICMACSCSKCKELGTPNRVCAKIRVLTSRHHVYDASEAQSATCRLFFDSENSETVALPVIGIDHADHNTDLCELTCVTCDKSLPRNLSKMIFENGIQWKNLNEQLNFSDLRKVLVFIISHPHGMPKHVSLGYLREGQISLSYYSTYTYTTPTCPGSSGAKVNIVRRCPDTYNLFNCHVHAESVKGNVNMSALGKEHLNCFSVLQSFFEAVIDLNI